MPNKLYISHSDLSDRAKAVVQCLGSPGLLKRTCYPVPRGGIPAVYLLQQHCDITITNNVAEANFILDDLIDSGATRDHFQKNFPGKPFYALIDKQREGITNWIIFPWEHTHTEERSVEDNVIRLLQFIGEDPKREGLQETPARFIKAWEHWSSGYNQKPEDIFKTFTDGGETYDEMILVKDIPFYSHCEHHLAPFFGTATIAYIPNGKIVGLSKLSRLVDIYARRLQVQERLTSQVVSAIWEHLEPLGVACLIKARHLCCESRGISKQGHYTITSSLKGVIRDLPAARAEFMSLANNGTLKT